MSAHHADLIAEIRAAAAEWESVYGHPNYAANLALAVQAADALEAQSAPLGREPQPSDGPDYHAEHAAWLSHQPAPLVADSREALAEWERYTFGISNGTQAWVEFQGAIGTVTDALLASGVVSLAADRDRLVAEQCAQIAEHPTWHPLGRLNDAEHAVAVRIAAAIRAYGAESEGE
jgi:hypothetical protein